MLEEIITGKHNQITFPRSIKRPKQNKPKKIPYKYIILKYLKITLNRKF